MAVRFVLLLFVVGWLWVAGGCVVWTFAVRAGLKAVRIVAVGFGNVQWLTVLTHSGFDSG